MYFYNLCVDTVAYHKFCSATYLYFGIFMIDNIFNIEEKYNQSQKYENIGKWKNKFCDTPLYLHVYILLYNKEKKIVL